MSRLSDAFPRGRTALVCYVMAGDPSLASTEELLLATGQRAVDVVDDLPERRLVRHREDREVVRPRHLDEGRRHALEPESDAEPERARAGGFAAALRDAGIAGCIVPDLPLEEAAPLREELDAAGVDLVPLVAPTTPMERAAAIAKLARGFVYTVSVTGVTGARTEFPPDLAARLRELRAISSLPVAVGFGIARPVQAAALRGLVDGIVVGSALVAAHHEGGVAKATELVRGLKAALQ